MKRAIPVILLTVICAAGCGTADSTTSSRSRGTTASPPTTIIIPDGDTATVTHVFDGDSFEAEIEGDQVEVRMLGINAPEGDECHGDAARDRLRELIEGANVTLVQDGADDRDRFGRILRSVYAADAFVNAVMVKEGHAMALQSGDPQEANLVTLTDAAYAERLGMWSPDACGEGATPAIHILDVEYDPPGRDEENKTDEWVVVFNDGDTDVDLGGWIIRDESSSHRYRFPDNEVLAPGDELRVRTGCGDDRGSDRYWCAADAVWSNGGDSVIVQTAAGTVVDRFRYPGDY